MRIDLGDLSGHECEQSVSFSVREEFKPPI
jgi:hypothetical protein